MNVTKILPEIEVEIAGEKKLLVFNCLALCKLEEMTGKNVLGGEIFTNPDMRTLTLLLWAGLSTHDPELTVEQLRAKLHPTELVKMYQDVQTAFFNASPSETEDGEKKSEIPA